MSILDVGCNCGIFLSEARKIGFTVHGVEPNEIARRKAIESGLPEVAPCFESINDLFDYITLFNENSAPNHSF